MGKIRAAAIAGVDWIQIREKDLSGKDCVALTREALQRAAKSPPAAIASKFPVSAAGAGTAQFSTAAAAAEFSVSKIMPARILVNDRLDVAISENAGGVHLGEKSLPIAEAKRLADARAGSRDFLIGVSCHSLQDAESAAIFFLDRFLRPRRRRHSARRRDWTGSRKFAAPCSCPCLRSVALRWRIPRLVLLLGRQGSQPFAFSRTLRICPWLLSHCEKAIANQRGILPLKSVSSRRRSRICPAW